MMNGAKESAFEIEAENIIDGAKLKYSDDLLDNTLPATTTVTIGSSVTGYCYDIYDLGDYVDKTFDATKYVGSVLIDATNNNYYIWYTDNSHSVTASATVKGGSIVVDATTTGFTAAGTANWDTCIHA